MLSLRTTLVAGVVALAIVGCEEEKERGDTSPLDAGGGVAPRGGDALVDAQAAWARCMREQGIDLPDPTSGDRLELDPDAEGSPGFERASRACEAEQKAIADAAPNPSEDELAQDRGALLDFARCMRDHGQDVPDPTSQGSGASVEVPAGSKGNEAFEKAAASCEDHLREVTP